MLHWTPRYGSVSISGATGAAPVSTAVRWPHSWADPCVQVCVPYHFESAAALKIPNHGLADCSDFLYPGHPCDSPRCRAVAAGPWSIPPLVAALPRWVLCGWPTALSRLTQKAPHREKSAVDLQPLTAIQQNNFTPQLATSPAPITLTVCVTICPSTTSRQHYFHRTAPLYMRGTIILLRRMKNPPRGRSGRSWWRCDPKNGTWD